PGPAASLRQRLHARLCSFAWTPSPPGRTSTGRRRDGTGTDHARALRLAALEMNVAAQHARTITHDLQSHACRIRPIGHTDPIVGDRQTHLTSRAVQVQLYSPRRAVPGCITDRLLRNPVQMIGALGAQVAGSGDTMRTNHSYAV